MKSRMPCWSRNHAPEWLRSAGVRCLAALLLLGPVSLRGASPTIADPAAPASFPPPQWLGDLQGRGANIQRTMRLLATSTLEHRNTVRILFYGQSITEQRWWKSVAADLRARFPNANLIIENRALGGFAAQMLVKTAETDLYPFQPDLLIFHVFGADQSYRDIIRRVRERTTAEILQQDDHLGEKEHPNEDTAPAHNPRDPANWPGYMNYVFLPGIAREYGTEYLDQRSVWRRYLQDYHLGPRALLRDGIHLNDRGEYLMSTIVESYLRYDPTLPEPAADQWIKTYVVGTDLHWIDGTLRLTFRGNRIDAVTTPNHRNANPAAIRIDGKRPSEHPELYGFTRALAIPGAKWPVIAPISFKNPPVLEDWTMQVTTHYVSATPVAFSDHAPEEDRRPKNTYTFTLTGSVTGPDGSGSSNALFTSNSGRVVIAPDAWNVDYALALPKIKPVPPTFTVHWKVVPHFVDAFVAPTVNDDTIEPTVTLAQGLGPGEHILEIDGDASVPITALRVYSPPLLQETAAAR